MEYNAYAYAQDAYAYAYSAKPETSTQYGSYALALTAAMVGYFAVPKF